MSAAPSPSRRKHALRAALGISYLLALWLYADPGGYRARWRERRRREGRVLLALERLRSAGESYRAEDPDQRRYWTLADLQAAGLLSDSWATSEPGYHLFFSRSRHHRLNWFARALPLDSQEGLREAWASRTRPAEFRPRRW